MLDHIVYLTESGVIQVELPNTYDRWTSIPKDSYCIDYLIGVEPRFWAILQDKTTPSYSASGNILLFLIIAKLLSCFFMLLVLIVYSLLAELRNLCGLILMVYVFNLFVAFLLLSLLQIHNVSKKECLPVASGLYFFFLAAFCWMTVMCFDMWWTFRSILKPRLHGKGDRFKFLMYCLFGWGVPLLMTIGMVLVNIYNKELKQLPWFITPGIPEKKCSLLGGVKLLYFYMPMLILIVCNWMFYLMTAFNIWRLNQGTAVLDSSAAGNKQAHRAQTQRFMLYLKLSVVMGLSWLLEISSFMWPTSSMWFLSDLYNSLIGVVMFLIFVCKKKIWKKLLKCCGGKKTMCWSSKSTSRSKADSSQDNTALQSFVSTQPNGLY